MSAKRAPHLALVFRHGDRTPIFNAHEPLGLESSLEAASWSLSLSTRAFERTLNDRFPVDNTSTTSTTTRDKAGLGKTFGSLTSLGALQMRRLGRIVASQHPEGITPRRIWSSNFTRTQFSLQCLLAGLAPLGSDLKVHAGREILNIWGTDPTLRKLLKSGGKIGMDIAGMTTPEENEAKRVFSSAIPAFAFQIRPFSWMSALDFVMCREGKQGGGGILRGRPNPSKQLELFGDMLGGSDKGAGPENLILNSEAEISPHQFKQAVQQGVFDCPFADADQLLKRVDRDGSGSIDFAEMKLFFESLRLPTCSGVSERELQEAAKVVESAVCSRFDSILSQPAIRKISCGWVAKTLLEGLAEARRQNIVDDNSNGHTTIDLYSAHDVTLIPLIKHLGVWDGQKDCWPGVSAALLFCFDGDRVSVRYWQGVRGGTSGLENHTMQFNKVDISRAIGGQGEDDKDEDGSVDLGRFKRWVNGL